MTTTRDCVREYLLAGTFNTVTGYNDRSVQYQGDDDSKKVFGLYNEEGDWERETFDVELALDYIGMERDKPYNPVYEAYQVLVKCKDGEEAIAINDAIGYLGEALESETIEMTLMEKLAQAGYPKEEMYHHCSDLYVFVTPLTQRVINEWFKEQGYNRDLFVSIFKDQITGKPMYDVAFNYAPWWEGDRTI